LNPNLRSGGFGPHTMLHVAVIAFALMVNPVTQDEQLARIPMDSALACADVLNNNHTVDSVNGPYYMVKGECKGVYYDDEGSIVSWDGDAQ
jgi:hypothetical protein